MVLKFADDGTVKVVGSTLEECLCYLEIVLKSFGDWTSKWRMVINCDANKTEVICFNTTDKDNLPASFKLSGKDILLTSASKVLGITLDKQLNFKQHSQAIYNKLIYRWVTLSRYTNRNWGMNQAVLVRIAKAIMFPSLFYGSVVWMSASNMEELNRIWYRVTKCALGAVFNVQGSIAEVILGVPPLQVTNRVISTKHYLKTFSSTTQDAHQDFLFSEIESGNTAVLHQLRDVIRFLQFKIKEFPKLVSLKDQDNIRQADPTLLAELDKSAFNYTKRMVDLFTEGIWQESSDNLLQMKGWTLTPQVSVRPLVLPLYTSRETEVLIMSLMYRNNLLNYFLFTFDRLIWKSPICSCGTEEQTAMHLLTRCPSVDEELSDAAIYYLVLCNKVNDMSEILYDDIAILNSSRDPKFIDICCQIVMNDKLMLRKKIELPKRKKDCNSQ